VQYNTPYLARIDRTPRANIGAVLKSAIFAAKASKVVSNTASWVCGSACWDVSERQICALELLQDGDDHVGVEGIHGEPTKGGAGTAHPRNSSA
jgi:hypothetical protein